MASYIFQYFKPVPKPCVHKEFASQRTQSRTKRHATLIKAVTTAAEFASTSSSGPHSESIPVCGKGVVALSTEEKYKYASPGLTMGPLAAWRAMQRCLSEAGRHVPSRGAMKKWVRALREDKDKLVQAAQQAHLPPPTVEAMRASGLAALEDGRVNSGRFVPRDILDMVAANLRTLEDEKVPFSRADVRTEFMCVMSDNPEWRLLLKTEDNPSGFFVASEKFLKRFEEEYRLTRRRITSSGTAGLLPPGMTRDCMRQLLRARLAHIIHVAAVEGQGYASIPPELVVGADETGIHLVPIQSTVLATKGSKQVERSDFGDKRQITAMVAHSFAGDMLPTQLIFKGVTCRVLPQLEEKLRKKYKPLLSFTANHWANHASLQAWISHVLVPYFTAKKRQLGLPQRAQCLLLWDVWHAHRSAEMLLWLRRTYPWIRLAFVPARCTSFLQVADVSINKALKAGVERKIREWQIQQRKAGMSVRSVPQLRLQVARAVVVALGDMDRSIVINGVRKTGLDSVWHPAGKQEALAAAKALLAAGKLWSTTSTKDVVLQNGATTTEAVQASAAAAGAADPTAATSGPVVGGKKRPREYVCGYCRQPGHTAARCPEKAAGSAPHPEARSSVKRAARLDQLVAW